MNNVQILHLSDLHFSSDDNFGQDRVLKPLAERIYENYKTSTTK